MVNLAGRKEYELLFKLQNGLVISELEGLHAGVDTVSGDFSLKAAGFLVVDGVIVRPVSNITVAGNFITMMKDVTALGNDLKFGMPGGGFFGAPSMLVSGLTVAGN